MNAIHRTIRRRRIKTTFSGDDDQKSAEIPDDRRTRKYLKISAIDGAAKWSSVSAADSVPAILKQFAFRKESDRDLVDDAQCVLKHSVRGFMIVIYDATTLRHFYLFTKHRVAEWSPLNVHRVMVRPLWFHSELPSLSVLRLYIRCQIHSVFFILENPPNSIHTQF